MKRSTWWWVAVIACAATAPAVPAAAQSGEDFPRGKVSGYIFGDAYYNVSGDPDHSYGGSGADALSPNISSYSASPNVIGKDLNGFQIRRMYLQFDNDLSVKYSTRVRFEAEERAETEIRFWPESDPSAVRTFIAVIGSLILLKLVDLVSGVRVSEEEEYDGLDLTQHGESGYNFEEVFAATLVETERAPRPVPAPAPMVAKVSHA